MSTGTPLPPEQPVSFTRPPVTEVAFAVQFVGDAIDLEVLGAVAGAVKSSFPVREQHPPLPPMGEQFDPAVPAPQIIFKTQPDLPRTWFVSEDGQRLLQLQPDRFAFNWRRTATGQEYPRYKALREEFAAQLAIILQAVADVNPAVAGINVCELTYVNELVSADVGRPQHPELSHFLRVVGPLGGQEFLPSAEDASFQARWRISEDGTPLGRLYASAAPAFRRENTAPIYLMTMTARLVTPGAEPPPQPLELLDRGHDWIVRGFKDLTTDQMHEVWGLQEGT